LNPADPVLDWAFAGTGIASVSRRGDELSVVAAEDVVPDGIEADTGWRAFEVAGPMDLSLTGILASLAHPLAEAGIPVFAVSTYETDLVLVQDRHLQAATDALRGAGHVID